MPRYMQVSLTHEYQRISCISYFGIHGSSSRGLRDPPREFPLYTVCRVPYSAVKHLESSICSSACKSALYSPTALYSDIVALASPKIPPTIVAHFQQLW